MLKVRWLVVRQARVRKSPWGIPWSTEYTECHAGFLSCRPNWVLPPHPQESVAPPLWVRGGDTLALRGKGSEGSQSDDGTDTLVYNTVGILYNFSTPTEPAAVKIRRRASANVMNE